MSARRFKLYPACKDSGVECLGEVPAHWEVKKVKRFCLVRRGASPRPIDDPIYFDDEGEYAWVRIADVTASERYLERTTQRLSNLGKAKSVALEPGELFVSIAATVGKPVITKIKCCIHDGFVYFVGLHENREFLFYLFSCAETYKGLGKLGTQVNLNTDAIGDIYLPRPPSAEQDAIVHFLDRETARIDALVEKKERLIALLQEQRTALITRAVTKGLDPTVPMEDSGVEWLGEIPAHWEVNRTKFAARLRSGHTPSRQHPEYWQDCTIPWFGLSDVWQIRDGQIEYVYETAEKISELGLANSAARLLPRGTVILSRTASVGFSAILGVDMATTQDFVNWVCGPTLQPEYLLYVFRSMQHEFRRLTMGSTHQTIYMPDVGDFSTPIPPVPEQDQIVAVIRKETARIDTLVAKVRDAIDRLKELRTALISAAVTGKIDVREGVV